jgi:hypothetical protein
MTRVIIPHYEFESWLAARRPPYRTPQSTIDAFWYVVCNYDDAGIERWLDKHPRDRLYLIDLLDVKNAK